MERYTVTEAAWLLGVSTDAIRKRVQRNTIKHERINGTLYVWLDADETRRDRELTEALTEAQQGRFEEYREQIAFLRRELERKDAIILTMAQRISELESTEEPDPEPRNGHETVSEDAGNGGDVPQEQEQPKSWLRRWFGG